MNVAASMLGVSPSTLRGWERRFGFPTPQRTEGGHRQFELDEIESLRQAFQETQNASSAISIARQRGRGLASPRALESHLASFDEVRADRSLEESLAVRSVERTVESTLLAAVEALSERYGPQSAEYGFAWRYASGWIAAVQRVAPPATREEGVVIFDATRPGDIDWLCTQALELFVRRAGLRALTLPLDPDGTRIVPALHTLSPHAIVLAGRHASLDAIGRLVYVARQACGGIAVFDFRGALPRTGASTVVQLGPGPGAALDELRSHLLGPVTAPSPRFMRAVDQRVSV